MVRRAARRIGVVELAGQRDLGSVEMPVSVGSEGRDAQPVVANQRVSVVAYRRHALAGSAAPTRGHAPIRTAACGVSDVDDRRTFARDVRQSVAVEVARKKLAEGAELRARAGVDPSELP